MRAWAITNGELHLVERPTPDPGPGDVLVSVRAAGINAADLLQRAGFYPAPPGVPADVPGLEMAGVVSAHGEGVDPALAGRRVCAVVGGGAHATHCVVPAEHLIEIPDHVDWPAAGGFAEAFSTAHDALVTQAGLCRGERVLISGAAGGVGVAAVQIAVARGAHVVAVTRDDTHHPALRELGAHDCITTDEVAHIDLVDVVLELVGAAHLEVAQRRLAPFARVVVIGVGAGSKASIDLLGIMTTRASVTGSTLRARDRAAKASVATAVSDELVPLWRENALRVPLAGTVAFDELPLAYERFSAPGKFGKFVVVNDD